MLHIEGGEQAQARCLLISTGAEYRKLGVAGCERFEGCGVYYAATPMEAQMCRGSEVVVVGGGNSAGQAAVYLAGQVGKVYLVIRGNDLYEHMSSYLADRIKDTPNIEVLLNSEVNAMHGDGFLSSVEIVNQKTGEVRTIQTPALFSFIGAVPRTDWLPEEIERDEKGFVLTGTALGPDRRWANGRNPFLLETSQPGVFAAGDVRSGSIKRVASAVGEGAMAVQFVHEFLKEIAVGTPAARADRRPKREPQAQPVGAGPIADDLPRTDLGTPHANTSAAGMRSEERGPHCLRPMQGPKSLKGPAVPRAQSALFFPPSVRGHRNPEGRLAGKPCLPEDRRIVGAVRSQVNIVAVHPLDEVITRLAPLAHERHAGEADVHVAHRQLRVSLGVRLEGKTNGRRHSTGGWPPSKPPAQPVRIRGTPNLADISNAARQGGTCLRDCARCVIAGRAPAGTTAFRSSPRHRPAGWAGACGSAACSSSSWTSSSVVCEKSPYQRPTA